MFPRAPHQQVMQAVSAAAVAALVAIGSTATGAAPAVGTQAVAVPQSCSRTWVGDEPDIEAYLRSVKVLRLEAVPIGVTRPQRAVLEPGGPVARFAWKALPPAMKSGYRESYKAEIAAYLVDRLLDLHMVPPVVEREVNGTTGAAVYWIEHTRPWDKDHPPQGPEPGWSRQVSTMKLFDQLIANNDRNQGNLLYDADWHLFLIDHSRAFLPTTSIKVSAAPTRITRTTWERMDALTAESIQAAVGPWLSGNEVDAMIKRRDAMRRNIQAMVKQRGEADVFLR